MTFVPKQEKLNPCDPNYHGLLPCPDKTNIIMNLINASPSQHQSLSDIPPVLLPDAYNLPNPRVPLPGTIGSILAGILRFGLGAATLGLQYGVPAYLKYKAEQLNNKIRPVIPIRNIYDWLPEQHVDFEPAPETPIRSVPDRDTSHSNRVSQAYAQTVQTIQDAYREQIDTSLNHPQTGHTARAIAAVYSPVTGPVTQYDVPPVVMDPVEATSAAFTAGGLAELKGSGASNVAPVTEDADWIQNNLAMARRPVSMRDLMASEALQRQADLSRMALEARLDNEIAQTELARAQAQEIRWRQYEARRQARAVERKSMEGKAIDTIFNGIRSLADFFLLDDINTIIDPKAGFGWKLLAISSFLPIGKFAKGGKLLTRVVGSSDNVLKHLVEKGLNPEQLLKYENFVRKRGARYYINVYELPNRGKVFEMIKPGKVPGSYAHWESYIDMNGKTVIMGKRSYDNMGAFIHWHEYLPFNQLSLSTEEKYITRIRTLLEQHHQ
ncbi:MAG: hypothetical protein AB7P76_03350 [Candidatus Melainabacteria bacterium]